MLVIKEANYGTGSNFAQVTTQLQSLIKDGDSIDITVNTKTMGTDPSPGSKKVLSVIYVADGVQEAKEIPDGSNFSIYTAKEKPATGAAAEGAKTVRDLVYTALSAFLHILGIGIAYRVGSALFSKVFAIVLTGVAAYIPYFGLWGVPLLVFTMRLFRADDIPTLTQMVENGTTVAPTAPPA